MAKYSPLRDYLNSRTRDRVTLTFDDLEDIIKDKLPASAYKHRAWWGNHGGTHVNAIAWLEAGWMVETVNQTDEWVVFARAEDNPPLH